MAENVRPEQDEPSSVELPAWSLTDLMAGDSDLFAEQQLHLGTAAPANLLPDHNRGVPAHELVQPHPENEPFIPPVSEAMAELWRKNDDRVRKYQTVVLPINTGTVLDPRSQFDTTWRIFMVLCLFTISFIEPLWLAFGHPLWFVYNALFALIWLVDVVITLNTAIIVHESKMIIDRWTIYKQYAFGWLLLDVTAVAAFALSAAAASIPSLWVVSFYLKIISLMRAWKIFQNFTIICDRCRVDHTLERVIRLIIFGLLLVHWICCGFIGVGIQESTQGRRSWIQGLTIDEENVALYIAALYWAIATLTTVGYGDIVGFNGPEKIFSMLAIMVGTGSMAFIVTNMVAYVGNSSKRERAFNENMDLVNAYLNMREVPIDLVHRVRKFHLSTFRVHDEDLDHELEITKELSPTLWKEVAVHVYEELKRTSSFFDDADVPDALKDPEMFFDLHLAMRSRVIPPGETIYRQSEIGASMFVILDGEVEMLKNGVPLPGILSQGSYFGADSCLSLSQSRVMTARTRTWVNLRELKLSDMMSIIWHYPLSSKMLDSMSSIDLRSSAEEHPPAHSVQVEIVGHQKSFMRLLYDCRRSLYYRNMSRMMFMPAVEPTFESFFDPDTMFHAGSFDMAAMQEAVLSFNFQQCNVIAGKLIHRIRQLQQSQLQHPLQPVQGPLRD